MEKKRRKNAQQPEERKEKMRRGLLHSFVGLMESVQLPEWLKFSLFNDLLLTQAYVKTPTEWILFYPFL